MNRRPRDNAFARRVIRIYGLLEANACGRRWSPAFGGMPPHSAKSISTFDLAWMRFETVRRALMRDGQKQRHAVPRSRDVRAQTWASTLRKAVSCAAVHFGVRTRSSVPTLCRTGKGWGTHFEHGSRAKAGEKQQLAGVKPAATKATAQAKSKARNAYASGRLRLRRRLRRRNFRAGAGFYAWAAPSVRAGKILGLRLARRASGVQSARFRRRPRRARRPPGQAPLHQSFQIPEIRSWRKHP